MNEHLAYALGRDCALNGANQQNCNFSIFSRAEFTRAWERGKATATTMDAPASPLTSEPDEKSAGVVASDKQEGA